VAESIMLNDSRLWKGVRKAWMKIVIEGILRDYDDKLLFSRVYTY
jgi:hypothetical protein